MTLYQELFLDHINKKKKTNQLRRYSAAIEKP